MVVVLLLVFVVVAFASGILWDLFAWAGGRRPGAMGRREIDRQVAAFARELEEWDS